MIIIIVLNMRITKKCYLMFFLCFVSRFRQKYLLSTVAVTTTTNCYNKHDMIRPRTFGQVSE